MKILAYVTWTHPGVAHVHPWREVKIADIRKCGVDSGTWLRQGTAYLNYHDWVALQTCTADGVSKTDVANVLMVTWRKCANGDGMVQMQWRCGCGQWCFYEYDCRRLKLAWSMASLAEIADGGMYCSPPEYEYLLGYF